eukprot:COSAG05_NODE_642_length_8135_cov_20.343703_6_plen_86_part_00
MCSIGLAGRRFTECCGFSVSVTVTAVVSSALQEHYAEHHQRTGGGGGGGGVGGGGGGSNKMGVPAPFPSFPCKAAASLGTLPALF